MLEQLAKKHYLRSSQKDNQEEGELSVVNKGSKGPSSGGSRNLSHDSQNHRHSTSRVTMNAATSENRPSQQSSVLKRSNEPSSTVSNSPAKQRKDGEFHQSHSGWQGKCLH
jgi:hypothetical protein